MIWDDIDRSSDTRINREPKTVPTHMWSIDFWQSYQGNGEVIVIQEMALRYNPRGKIPNLLSLYA